MNPSVTSSANSHALRNPQEHFLWLLSPRWDGVQTRQQHFARRLARRGIKVLYVENPTAWSSVIRQRSWGGSAFNAHEGEVEPNLHVLRPTLSLPGSMRSDVIAAFNGRILARQLSRWFTSRRWTDYLAWCRVPAAVFPLTHLKPRRIVYDITDDYALYARGASERDLTVAREGALIQKADLVFVTAAELLKKPSLQPANPTLLPNGVEYDLFARVSGPGAVHPSLLNLKKPLIGYVGLTSYWMDFDLLAKLGRRWPGQVVMVGPIQPQLEAKAKDIPGIVWAGFVPQQELPPYLRAMDVLIMPHQVNELRKKANPLKIWEYLATGKPFVTIDIPALDVVRHLVHVAHNPDEFISLITQCLHYDPPTTKAARQALAKHYSWDALFETLMSSLLPTHSASAPYASVS